MKKKSFISLVLALVIVTTMCVCPISASAATVENTTTESVVTEDGWSYVEFTVPETYSTRSAFTDADYASASGKFGDLMVADGDYVSVAARGTNTGQTVIIYMEVQGAFNQFYTVNDGVRELVCNGTSQLLFESFKVQKGKTYRFYYLLDDTQSDVLPYVTLVANFWDL